MKAKYVDIEVGKAYDLWSIFGVIPVIVIGFGELKGSVEVVNFWTSKEHWKYPELSRHVWDCNLHPLTYHELPWYRQR